MRTIITTFALVICLLWMPVYATPPMSSLDLMNTMLRSIENINSLKFKLKSYERVNGKMQPAEADVKLAYNPKRLYLYSHLEPNKGVEILWKEGQNNGNALVNPGKFPYFNVNLDPYGSMMRKNQHHPVLNSGFTFLHNIIAEALKRAKQHNAVDTYFTIKDDAVLNGRECYMLEIIDPEFSYVKYTVKEGETIDDISKRLLICGYLVVEKNPGVDFFDDVDAGDELLIPSSYAKKTVLYIDKDNYLPIGQYMYDDKGLFERYEFVNLKVNPRIAPEEFTEDYEAYGF